MNIRELARLAGVSKTTAAYAIKNDPRISEPVRLRIQELAKEYGYNPNPLVKAYMQEVRKSKVVKSRQYSLCYLSSIDQESGRSRHARYAFERDIIAGASAEAERLGYPFEVITWDTRQMTAERMDQILFTRGIRGILVGPGTSSSAQLYLNWDSYAAVAYGHSLVNPDLNRYCANLLKAAFDFSKIAFERNYHTLIFALEKETDERVGRRWLSAASALQAIHGKKQVHVFVDKYAALTDPILDKLKRAKAPVVIGPSGLLHSLKKRDIRIPEDVGFVANDDEHTLLATAIAQPNYNIGRLSIDQLSMLIECGRWGIPEIPCTQMIPCGWHEGETLPAR